MSLKKFEICDNIDLQTILQVNTLLTFYVENHMQSVTQCFLSPNTMHCFLLAMLVFNLEILIVFKGYSGLLLHMPKLQSC